MFSVNSIIFFILTLLLMAFFAGIEMAFYSANRLSLEVKKKQGGSSMLILSRFIESPAKFLGTTLIGFHLFLVFFSLQISTFMSPVWDYLGLHLTYVRLVAEITLATFVVLVFAGFIPRAFFRANSNNWLIRLTYVSDFFYQMFAPVATGLIDLSEWLLKYVFNIRIDSNKEPINRSDLKNLFQPGEDEERQERNTQLLNMPKKLKG